MLKKKKRKIIKIKQSFEWNYVHLIMENLTHVKSLFDDEEFEKIYNDMMKCIDKHLNSPYHGDYIRSYVIVEQEAD